MMGRTTSLRGVSIARKHEVEPQAGGQRILDPETPIAPPIVDARLGICKDGVMMSDLEGRRAERTRKRGSVTNALIVVLKTALGFAEIGIVVHLVLLVGALALGGEARDKSFQPHSEALWGMTFGRRTAAPNARRTDAPSATNAVRPRRAGDVDGSDVSVSLCAK
jgi:hypothetical protein